MPVPYRPQDEHLSSRPQPPGSGPDSGFARPRPPGLFDVPGGAQPYAPQFDAPDSGAPFGAPRQYEQDTVLDNPGEYMRAENSGFIPESDPYARDGQLPPETGDREEDTSKRKLRQLIIAVSVLFVLWLLFFQVFVIRKVNVSGTSAEIWKTVAKAAGLDHSPFYFFVNESKVREGIESNRYLIFESMEKIIPGTVNIKVIQRRPYAFFIHLGVGYVLSKDGMILEKTRELKVGENLMKVVGLAVNEHQSPGSIPASTDPSQTEVLLELFEELDAWDFASQVDTLDISKSLSLTLLTKDGYTINLGSDSQLHAKIGTVASVVNELRRRQMTGGIIEATRPGEATYRSEQ